MKHLLLTTTFFRTQLLHEQSACMHNFESTTLRTPLFEPMFFVDILPESMLHSDVKGSSIPLISAIAFGVLLLGLLLLIRHIHHIRHLIRQSERHAAGRLLLIRDLLDLGYTYGESPLVFLEKFKEQVHIRRLKSYNLLDFSDKRYQSLKEDERILCILLNFGFTHRELCTIYNQKRVGNLYVKYHRIREKLKCATETQMPPAALCKKNSEATSEALSATSSPMKENVK